MTRNVILGCLAAFGLVLAGYRLGRAADQLQAAFAQVTDPTHEGCRIREGRLLAELRSEIVKTEVLGRSVDTLLGRVDQLEHEQAIDRAPYLGDEAEQFLADREGEA
jgi:hypothetical protein